MGGIGTSFDGLDVNVQDQTTPPIAYFFTQQQGAKTTVATATAIDDSSVTITDASGCSIGDYFGMFNADNPIDNRAYFGIIQNIATNTVTLDTPIDFAFQIGDTAACFTRDMNVTASQGSPEVFQVEVGSAATQSIDITRLMFTCLTDSAVDLSKFGDIVDGIENGLVLRRVNGFTNNIWNIKTNGELANLAYDFDVNTATNPAQGQDGFLCRYTFAGPDKHGVAVRLDPGDSLQLIVQDDLSSLIKYRVIAEGHYIR
jgi:hypothetical protein